ncbi:competence protein CoiA [Jeotgalibacillus sp. JSM ZJ347]|uniref:competence protein CoiA n=1 Tax=Jeotgalibacillus sp. JSM ZJ347 TaxID=3342117 RepID=UPI0035A93A35
MLIAETLLGEQVSLYQEKHNNPRINALRSQQLRCPSCKTTVLVKAGKKVIPHFAHQSKASCTGFSENESIFHLQAKTSLYQWFTQQSLHPELEKTYHEINRRADLAIKTSHAEFAVEFQCSPLSAELQRIRSSDYRQIGVIPFWILPAEFIQKASIIKLSSFHQQFIRYSHLTDQYYLLTYSFEEQSFTIYHHLIPLSKTLFATSYTTLPQNEIRFPSYPISIYQITEKMYESHLKMNEKWLINIFKYRKSVRDPLMRKLYENAVSLFETPPWVGVLLKSNVYFSCSPMEWQFYLYLKIRSSHVFYNTHLIGELKQLMHKRVLNARSYMEPLPSDFLEVAVEELLQLLLECKLINKHQNGYTLTPLESNGICAHNRSEMIKKFHDEKKNLIIKEYNRR